MGQETATVEVLTATVRTLMVGNRQVTLSVFGQLDTVPYDEIELMGRVRPKGHGDPWVIGRDASGNLVKAEWDLEWPRWSQDDQRRLASLQPRTDLSEKYQEELQELVEWQRDVPALQARWRARRAVYEALPLIVLAGLR